MNKYCELCGVRIDNLPESDRCKFCHCYEDEPDMDKPPTRLEVSRILNEIN